MNKCIYRLSLKELSFQWLEAIIHLVYPILDPIALMLINAMQTGASNYQSMALAITCISDIIDAIPDCLYTVISCLTEILPADIKPLYDSVLIQILFCALYTKLLECAAGEEEENEIPIIVNGEDVVNVIKSHFHFSNSFQKAILL